MLSPKTVFGFNNGCLEINDNYSININTQLSVIYTNAELKFKNFNSAKLIFDLKNIYKELSDTEIKTFINNHAFLKFQDESATFSKNLPQKTRRLFAQLDENKNNTINIDIPKKAKKIQDLTNIQLHIENNVICLPKKPDELYKVLHALLNHIFIDEDTNQKYIATSKEKL